MFVGVETGVGVRWRTGVGAASGTAGRTGVALVRCAGFGAAGVEIGIRIDELLGVPGIGGRGMLGGVSDRGGAGGAGGIGRVTGRGAAGVDGETGGTVAPATGVGVTCPALVKAGVAGDAFEGVVGVDGVGVDGVVRVVPGTIG